MKFSAGPDGSTTFEFDVEGLLSSKWDRVLGLFKHDAASVMAKEWLTRHTELGLESASNIQIVGMYKPVPLECPA